MRDMNNIRRSFLGDPKGSPKIPQEIKSKVEIKLSKNFDVNFLMPIHFSIIKKPISIYIEGEKHPRVSKHGVGAIQLYEYIGGSDDLKPIIECIEEYFNNKIEFLKSKNSNNWLTAVTDFKIILGKDYEDIK